MQKREIICAVTGKQKGMLTVRKVGSIIEKLKEMMEEYLKKTEPEYYPPVL